MTDKMQKFLMLVQTAATFEQLARGLDEKKIDPREGRLRRWGYGASGILAHAMRDVRDEHLAHIVDDVYCNDIRRAAEEYAEYVVSDGEPNRKPPSAWLVKIVEDANARDRAFEAQRNAKDR